MAQFKLYHTFLGLRGGSGWWFEANYLVLTQLEFCLFCCLGCGYCWAVTTCCQAQPKPMPNLDADMGTCSVFTTSHLFGPKI